MWARQTVVLSSQEMTCMEQAVKEERCEWAALLCDSWGAVILKVNLILLKLSRSSHLVFVYDTAEFLLNPLKVVISVTLSWIKSKKNWMMSQCFDEISAKTEMQYVCIYCSVARVWGKLHCDATSLWLGLTHFNMPWKYCSIYIYKCIQMFQMEQEKCSIFYKWAKIAISRVDWILN